MQPLKTHPDAENWASLGGRPCCLTNSLGVLAAASKPLEEPAPRRQLQVSEGSLGFLVLEPPIGKALGIPGPPLRVPEVQLPATMQSISSRARGDRKGESIELWP